MEQLYAEYSNITGQEFVYPTVSKTFNEAYVLALISECEDFLRANEPVPVIDLDDETDSDYDCLASPQRTIELC